MYWIQKLVALLVLFQVCHAQSPSIDEIVKPHEHKCRDCIYVGGHAVHFFPNGTPPDLSLVENRDFKMSKEHRETFTTPTDHLHGMKNRNSKNGRQSDENETENSEDTNFRENLYRVKRQQQERVTRPSSYTVGIDEQKKKLEDLTKTIETLEQDANNLKEEAYDLYRNKKAEISIHPENQNKIEAEYLERITSRTDRMTKILKDYKEAQEKKKSIEDKINELEQNSSPPPDGL